MSGCPVDDSELERLQSWLTEQGLVLSGVGLAKIERLGIFDMCAQGFPYSLTVVSDEHAEIVT